MIALTIAGSDISNAVKTGDINRMPTTLPGSMFQMPEKPAKHRSFRFNTSDGKYGKLCDYVYATSENRSRSLQQCFLMQVIKVISI